MAHVAVHRDDVVLDSPMLVEGMPGVGLVGKIAADHLVETFDMVEYASVQCEGLPQIAVYQDGEREVKPPVRLYADEERDLLVLQSDVPVSPASADDFASCLTDWLVDNDVTPIFLSGMGTDHDEDRSLYGVSSGDGDGLLDETDIPVPTLDGAVTGPTGALLSVAARRGLTSVGLIVEADERFPDPTASLILLRDGISPLTGVDVDTDVLIERAEEISEAKADLAQQMDTGSDKSTSAKPLGMFQ